MKKLLATLSLICLFTVSSSAQTEFHWGFKGGINFTTYDSDADDVQARMGQWGVLARWNFNEHVALQTELFYARMGVRSLRKAIKWFPEDAYYTGEDNLNQKFRLQVLTDNVQLPILVKWYLPVNLFGGHGLNVHAGPLFSQRFDYKISTSDHEGVLLDPALTGNGTPYVDGMPYRENNTINNFARAQNKTQFHIVTGIGYDSPTGIGVDIRWQTGITPVWNSSSKHCYNKNSHDRIWAICFSYTF